MNIDAFLDSLPIMGVGLLGIFIVTIVMIVGIKSAEKEAEKAKAEAAEEKEKDGTKNASKETKKPHKKESALDLLREKQKTDFLEEVDNNYISRDL